MMRGAALAALIVLALPGGSRAAATDVPEFDDRPLDKEIVLPDWFKLSFLELHDDLADAAKQGKRGLIVYFGQKDCPYCKAHLENNWENDDIVRYTQKYFDVVAVDVRGQRLVTALDGAVLTEKQFAIRQNTNFTPSLIFYDQSGKTALRLSGYHPPYQFRAALEFVADGHYRKERFRDYLARAEPATDRGQGDLNHGDFFSPPPFGLDRTRFAGSTPLVVFFEQRRCHACDVLHAGPLGDAKIQRALNRLESVQLDMNADTPVLTPDGHRLSARQWADQLGLFYAPTLIFFDERGDEIIRIDSVVQFYRLNSVLDYIVSNGYREQRNFQAWRRQHRK